MDLSSGRADPPQIFIISMIIGGRSAGRSLIRSCLVLRQRHNDIWGEFGLDPTIAHLYHTVSVKICQLLKTSTVQWQTHQPEHVSRGKEQLKFQIEMSSTIPRSPEELIRPPMEAHPCFNISTSTIFSISASSLIVSYEHHY